MWEGSSRPPAAARRLSLPSAAGFRPISNDRDVFFHFHRHSERISPRNRRYSALSVLEQVAFCGVGSIGVWNRRPGQQPAGVWGSERMSGDLVSVRILAAFGSPADRALLRQAAAKVPIPIDVVEAESASAARSLLSAGDIDVVFIEG